MLLYAAESRNRDTIEKYGRGTPDDWIESHLYSRLPMGGIIVLGIVDVAVFGIEAGSLIYGVQMAWIPFWAAGVVNGLGHYWGYRNYPVEDASTNLFPLGILIDGEEFHNNHHASPTSAKLSSAWYEFDIGWMYIRLLQTLGLARVRRIAPTPVFFPNKTQCDADTVKAIITHRYYVLAQYTRAVRSLCRRRIAEIKRKASSTGTATTAGEKMDAHSRKHVLRWLRLYTWDWRAHRPMTMDEVVHKDRLLHTVYSMRQQLSELWSPSSASTEHLLERLRDWRTRAEASGIRELQDFSRGLPNLV